MKFIVAFVAPVVALRVSDAHPTVNMVLTNDGAMDASEFSLAQKSSAKSLRGELADLIKSEESRNHASLAEVSGDFHQPNVVRINYEEAGHAMLAESIVRESVSADAPYEDGEIGLNLIPAGAGSAQLKQLMDSTEADFETEFRAGLHKSFLEGPAIRIRLPRGGLKEGDKLFSDDGRIAVRVLPSRRIPGGFTELASSIEKSGEKSEAAVNQLLSLFAQGKISKQELKQSGAASRCAQVMQSEGASDAMRGGCGSVITHMTNTPVASSIMDTSTGGAGHVTVVLPSPSRVYGR
jgi:hypothetical protein